MITELGNDWFIEVEQNILDSFFEKNLGLFPNSAGDIETLISEMAAHAYFYKISNGKDGFDWTNDNFIEILSNSEGSIKDDTTGELVLGDRYVFQQREKGKNNIQKEKSNITNPSKLGGFEEK
jgi:hypothetical protein